MEQVIVKEENNNSINGENIEEITIRIIKFLLDEKVSIETISHITDKSIEEIKEISGLLK